MVTFLVARTSEFCQVQHSPVSSWKHTHWMLFSGPMSIRKCAKAEPLGVLKGIGGFSWIIMRVTVTFVGQTLVGQNNIQMEGLIYEEVLVVQHPQIELAALPLALLPLAVLLLQLY
jgi:hypothetical protein